MDNTLKSAFSAAEPAVLLMVYTQITGDGDYLERFRPFIRKVREFSNDIPPELIADLHTRLEQALATWNPIAAPQITPALLRRMMDICVGEPVPEDYVPMLMEDLGFAGEDIMRLPADTDLAGSYPAGFRVAIVGAGLSGLCAAIYLRRAGVAFELYDRNQGVGGTWFENRYPGCGVDAANHWYSYSFAPKSDWSRYFVKQPELQSYLAECAHRFDLERNMHLGTEVNGAVYDPETHDWFVTLTGADGQVRTERFDAVVTAVGQLNNPSIPNIKGMDSFAGPLFHTARWPEGFEARGKRVAMLGTGASGVQVGPTIAPDVARLTIFQRSAQWVNQRANYNKVVSPGKMRVLSDVPFYARWYRFQLFWAYSDALYPALKREPAWGESRNAISDMNAAIREQWLDYLQANMGDRPDLMAQMVPDYPPFGKRPLFDNNWFETLKRDNVELVTERIAEINPTGIKTADGVQHDLDAIILATGFRASRMLFPIEISGRDGHTIRKDWGDEDPRAYLGITVPGFPNLFVMYGPNTNYAHGGSIVFNAECQARYILQCLALLRRNDASALEVRPEVFDAYNDRVDERHAGLVWSHPGVNTWYKNSAGRVTTNSPFTLKEYWALTHTANPEDFHFIA